MLNDRSCSNEFNQGDSLHDSMKCGGYIFYHGHQSSMINGALDVSGKLSLAQDASISSWAWWHVETTTLMCKVY